MAHLLERPWGSGDRLPMILSQLTDPILFIMDNFCYAVLEGMKERRAPNVPGKLSNGFKPIYLIGCPLRTVLVPLTSLYYSLTP